jgi:hypothetical protein
METLFSLHTPHSCSLSWFHQDSNIFLPIDRIAVEVRKDHVVADDQIWTKPRKLHHPFEYMTTYLDLDF